MRFFKTMLFFILCSFTASVYCFSPDSSTRNNSLKFLKEGCKYTEIPENLWEYFRWCTENQVYPFENDNRKTKWKCPLTEQQGKQIAKQALTFCNIPYAKDGIDTQKLYQFKKNLSKQLNRGIITDGGDQGEIRNCGISPLGLLEGVLSQTDYQYFQCTNLKMLEEAPEREITSERKCLFSKIQLRLKNYIIDEDDLLKIAIPVSDIKKIRPGDILIKNGRITKDIAIITKTDASDYGKCSVIFLEQHKNSAVKELPLKEIENWEFFFPWRIVLIEENNQEEKDNLFSAHNTSAQFEFSGAFEENQQSKTGTRLLIPNTGESLILRDVCLIQKNSWGFSSLLPEEKQEITLSLFQNGYEKDWRNSNSEYEISLHTNYGEKILWGSFYTNGTKKYMENRTCTGSLKTDWKGNIIFCDKNQEQKISDIFIRQKKEETAGDRISVTFTIKETDLSTEENNPLCVYNKKALWRANLFINTNDFNGMDWNNMYPWNAPAEKYKNNSPSWWSTTMGYNEWNLKVDVNSNLFDPSSFAGGKGRQEIYIQDNMELPSPFNWEKEMDDKRFIDTVYDWNKNRTLTRKPVSREQALPGDIAVINGSDFIISENNSMLGCTKEKGVFTATAGSSDSISFYRIE